MAKRNVVVPPGETEVSERVAEAILGFIADIPQSQQRKSRKPEELTKSMSNVAAAKAALAAGTLALPPGPAGWLTILPEMIVVWKLQSQLVSDIAALHGKSATLSEEQMLYCLFRHTASQAVRDLVVRAGQRVLVKRASLRVLQTVARGVGVKVTQRVISKGVARWIPIVGAVGVGGYAYYDTVRVAVTARELFESVIDVEPVSKDTTHRDPPRSGSAKLIRTDDSD